MENNHEQHKSVVLMNMESQTVSFLLSNQHIRVGKHSGKKWEIHGTPARIQGR